MYCTFSMKLHSSLHLYNLLFIRYIRNVRPRNARRSSAMAEKQKFLFETSAVQGAHLSMKVNLFGTLFDEIE